MDRIENKNYVKVLVLSMFGAAVGYFLAIFNPLGDPVFRGVYKLPEDNFKVVVGNVNMLFFSGAAVSMLLSGPIAERIGRRTLIIIYDVICLFSISLYAIEDLNILYLARFLNGLSGCGTQLVSAIYVTEVMPKSIGAVANTFMFAVSTTCVFLAYIQQNIFSRDFMIANWRYILCWPAVVIFFKVILMPIVIKHDSPKFYIGQNYGKEDLKASIKEIYSDTYRESQVDAATESIIAVHQKTVIESKSSKLAVLFSPIYRFAFATTFVISILAQFNGVSYFALYSTDLFNRVSGNGKKVTFFIAIAKVFGGVCAIIFMKNFGRKFNLMLGCLMQGVCIALVMISLYVNVTEISMAAVFLYFISFAIGLGGSVNAFVTEVIPPIGVSLISSFLCILNAMFGKLLPLAAAAYGDETLLCFFAICCFVGFFALDFFLIETKDKNEERILSEYMNHKYTFLNFK